MHAAAETPGTLVEAAAVRAAVEAPGSRVEAAADPAGWTDVLMQAILFISVVADAAGVAAHRLATPDPSLPAAVLVLPRKWYLCSLLIPNASHQCSELVAHDLRPLIAPQFPISAGGWVGAGRCEASRAAPSRSLHLCRPGPFQIRFQSPAR